MSNYDFSVLNDKEFEILVCDLLSRHFGQRIERFKPGKDAGVDGRWFASLVCEVIVQCKHWPRSSVNALVNVLATKERPKIDILKPSRYILVCSLGLSRDNKRKILSALSPHVLLESDVFGKEDLQDLLKKFPDVERANSKLWLSSSVVLAALLNNDVLGRSDDALIEIKGALRKYVETADSLKARAKLQKTRVLILTGEPGVGKTMLAQHLVTESVAEGYRLVVIQDEMSEAEAVFDIEAMQVFYFDDFLGRNFLEALENNKDSHILRFVSRVLRYPNKRFILTTRTHILDRGKLLSELFALEKIEKREFEVSVGKLTRIEKAKILYSHIWCGMPSWAVERLYEDKRYLKIVDHKNFNPRLISFITDSDRVAGISPGTFWETIKGFMDFPEAIWGHVFSQQLGEDSRDIAVLTAYNGGKPIAEEDLESAFFRLRRLSRETDIQLRQRFVLALRLVAGSVVTRTITSYGTTCSLFNPSIADYLLNEPVYLSSVPSIIEALRTRNSLDYLQSLSWSEHITAETFLSTLLLISKRLEEEGDFVSDFALNVARYLWRVERVRDERSYECRVGNGIDVANVKVAYSNYLEILSSQICAGLLHDSEEKFDSILEQVDTIGWDTMQLREVIQCAEYLDSFDQGVRAEEVKDKIVNMAEDMAHDMISDDDVLRDYIDLAEESKILAEANAYFENEFELIGLSLDSGDVERLVSNVNIESIVRSNFERATESFDEDKPSKTRIEEDPNSAIVDYFDRTDRDPGDNP